MRTYRSILQSKLKEAGLNQRQIAKAMGWSNQATVSLRLSGKRDWGEGELQKICALAGISVLWLADNSDDLIITNNRSAATLASIADNLTEEQRQAIIVLTKQMLSSQ